MTRSRLRSALSVSAASIALASVCVACTSTPETAAERAAPLTVATSSGRLHGLTTDRAREFLGVRYAQAPTGSRRWTMPSPAAPGSGTVSATKPGPSCAQAGSAPGAAATGSRSEDCLFLNVTTPKKLRDGEKLPVMVWWHGGGFTSGAGSVYDAQRLANRGRVVVVTVNYRLGVFGYLSLPGLAGSGNFGFADQILATRWARRNAAAFGGDPHNVTVFGESAGAMSACALLTSPAARGLVDKVAMSSGGSCQLSWPRDGLVPGAPEQTPYLRLDAARQLGIMQARQLGCAGATVVRCLREVSVKKLLTISPSFSDVLAYGTPLLPSDPAAAVRDGTASRIPVLSGNNRDEERAFVGGAQKAKPFFTAETYPTYLRSAFGSAAGRVASQYPLSKYDNAADAWATLITDASWACPTLRGNAALARNNPSVFGYEFADRNAPDVNMIGTPTFPARAAHASDVPYLFDLLGKDLVRSSSQRALANDMIDYWTSFARTGRPQAAASRWPALRGVTGPTLRLQPNRIAPTDLAADHHCGFWQHVSF